MSGQTHGYSGKPLFQKIGLKPGMRCLPIRPPDHFSDLVAGAEGVTFLRRGAPADCVWVFCARKRDVAPLFQRALKYASAGAMIWVAWPKKSSSLFIDLTEQDFRDHVLPLGWVDVKVCAIDQDWSGLKFLKRKTPKA